MLHARPVSPSSRSSLRKYSSPASVDRFEDAGQRKKIPRVGSFLATLSCVDKIFAASLFLISTPRERSKLPSSSRATFDSSNGRRVFPPRGHYIMVHLYMYIYIYTCILAGSFRRPRRYWKRRITRLGERVNPEDGFMVEIGRNSFRFGYIFG